MRLRLLHIVSCLFLLLLFGGECGAHDVVVVQGLRVKPFEEVVQGFRAASGATIRQTLLVDETPDVVRRVREMKPDLVLAVGGEALKRLSDLTDIPVVYAMVLNPRRIVADPPNMTGISMNIPAETYIGLLQKILPRARRIGVLTDPSKTSPLVRKGIQTARAAGIELVVREVHQPGDVPGALRDIVSSSPDALWILPDSTVANAETVEHIFLVAHEKRIPVFSSSEKHADLGALLTVSLDAYDMGRQAGEIARKIFGGVSPGVIQPRDVSSTRLTVNMKTAKKLGLQLSRELLKDSRVIR